MIALAQRVPGEDACAQARDIRALRRRAIRLVNAGRVPAALQEPLMSGVTALAAQTPVCLPQVPASATTPSPSPAPTGPTPPGPRDRAKGKHDHGHDHGHGHDGGKGRHG